MKTVKEYATACGDVRINVSGSAETEITHVTNDSREVKPGSLFIAIEGDQADGRRFIPAAVEQGAVAVCYKGEEIPGLALPAIRVTDDYVACGRIAELFYDYPTQNMLTIGITGTNGKTTTAFLVRELFRAAGKKTGMIGTVLYDLGDHELPADRTTPTPLHLQKMLAAMRKAGVEILIMEVSSHALCQKRMGNMRVDAAVFTNLTPEHLDYHKTMEHYYEAKKKLFTECLVAGGAAVVNKDDAFGRRLEQELDCRLITYGFDPKADVHPQRFDMDLRGTELEFSCGAMHSPLIGRYNAANVMAAAACGWCWGLGEDEIHRAVEGFSGIPGRLERVPNDRGLNIFVDYAHTGDALDNVLRCVRPLCDGELFVVFGCGGDRDRSKRPVMGEFAARLADRVYITSDNPRSEDPAAIIADIMKGIPAERQVVVEPDRRQAIDVAVNLARPGDAIVIAGKGHENYQEIGGVKHPYSDMQAVKDALAREPAMAT